MPRRTNVIVSQGQSQHPAKRKLEEDIVTALMIEPQVDVTVVPHLYDLVPDGTGVLALSGIPGDMIVLSWLYERAARWTLDRNDIRGLVGHTELARRDDPDEDELDDEDESPTDDNGETASRVADDRPPPQRRIYCCELTEPTTLDEVLAEVRRIAKESNTDVVQLGDWLAGDPAPDSLARFVQPTSDTALGTNGQLDKSVGDQAHETDASPPGVQRIEESADRRWYPVIDFSRCTNCMECIDFCLFGVYGVDGAETILVEQPDNCRKGCPACSRVCPENAIIFPQHKTPAIAGAPVAISSLKIDLSKLFGAPDAVDVAAQERDEQLVLAGREAVGMSVGIPRRQDNCDSQPRDDLDDLIDGLDELD